MFRCEVGFARWRSSVVGVVYLLLVFSHGAHAQAPASPAPPLAVQTGAPQPREKNQATPLPAQPPPPAGTPVVKVGGGMILAFGHSYAPEYDPSGTKKKPNLEAWRANIVLDAKLDRFGIHIDFRARDRGLRWMPVNAWLEEVYASSEFPELSAYGPLMLKVGKVYNQFGRFWDNSFYGNVHLRDGLKLVPDWGLSFEGTLTLLGALNMRYYAQYFVVDGQTSTANPNRDTISIVAPGSNTLVGARKRNQLVFRVEPTYVVNPKMMFAIAGSFSHFTADFPDSSSPAALMAGRGVKDIDDKSGVTRFGVDVTGQILWFGFWAELTKQLGRHTNAFPYAPLADNPTTMESEARPGAASDNVTYWMAGLSFTWDRLVFQYNFNSATYHDIPVPGGMGALTEHKEWIHNPCIRLRINDQLRVMLEVPFYLRKPAANLPPADPQKPATPTGAQDALDQSIVLSLHGSF